MDEDRVIDEADTGDDNASAADESEARAATTPRLPGNVASALCYLLSFASGVVFLVLEPDDRTIRFHAFQSILLGVVMMILQVGIVIISWVPPFGGFLGPALQWIVGVGWVVISIILMIMAFGGEDYHLPYIGEHAAKLARPYE